MTLDETKGNQDNPSEDPKGTSEQPEKFTGGRKGAQGQERCLGRIGESKET